MAKMGGNKEWKQLDQDLDKLLEAALAGAAEQKVNALTTVMYNFGKGVVRIGGLEGEHKGCTPTKQKRQGNPQPKARNPKAQQTVQKNSG